MSYAFTSDRETPRLRKVLGYRFVKNAHVPKCVVTPGPLITKWTKHLTARSGEVSKPRDSGLDFSNRSEIWQAPRQQRCRDACQISKRYDGYNPRPLDFRRFGGKTSYRLVYRSFMVSHRTNFLLKSVMWFTIELSLQFISRYLYWDWWWLGTEQATNLS